MVTGLIMTMLFGLAGLFFYLLFTNTLIGLLLGLVAWAICMSYIISSLDRAFPMSDFSFDGNDDNSCAFSSGTYRLNEGLLKLATSPEVLGCELPSYEFSDAYPVVINEGGESVEVIKLRLLQNTDFQLNEGAAKVNNKYMREVCRMDNGFKCRFRRVDDSDADTHEFTVVLEGDNVLISEGLS